VVARQQKARIGAKIQGANRLRIGWTQQVRGPWTSGGSSVAHGSSPSYVRLAKPLVRRRTNAPDVR
jgi:hypothetical protein